MAPAGSGGVPWSERHRPKHLGEVIGNTDQVRRLAEWLRDWDEVVLRGKLKEPPAPDARRFGAPVPENVNARAVLVSGPPGIGKTTTCCLVARCCPRYTLMEFNASDARGKAIIDSMSNSLAGNHTLRLGGGEGKNAIERAVIIMDECDGMSGGDKGGMVALMNMIKQTKNPIICICNDRSDQQVRTLAAMCYDIKFRRPENAAVARRIKHIMEGEGKHVELHTVEAVVEACGQDIRHIINQTQFFGSVAAHGKETQKDTQVMLSPFDACARLLSTASKGSRMLQLERRLDMYYLDTETVPLFIQENYLKAFELRGGAAGQDLSQCALAAELIALGDSMAASFEHMSSAAVVGTVYPAFLAADEAYTRPAFPAWLQKRAPMLKAERMAQEVQGRVRLFTTCSGHALTTSGYHDLLYRRLLRPLQLGAAKECAAALFACGLTREFFTDQAPALRQPLQLDDAYKKVDAKVKQTLLQEFQTLVQQAKPTAVEKRKRPGEDGRRRASRGEAGGADGEDDAPAEAPAGDGEGGEGDDAAGAAKRRKSGAAKKGAKESKASTKSTASSLSGWRPQKEEATNQDGSAAVGNGGDGTKKPLMIMKYLDGHTCAVRRKVRLKDLLEPWTLF